MAKVTKSDLIALLSTALHINPKEVHSLIDALWEEMKKQLIKGMTIELRGFGTFEIKRRKGKIHARNPKTGENVSVEDHGVAVFRPGKELKAESWKLEIPKDHPTHLE